MDADLRQLGKDIDAVDLPPVLTLNLSPADFSREKFAFVYDEILDFESQKALAEAQKRNISLDIELLKERKKYNNKIDLTDEIFKKIREYKLSKLTMSKIKHHITTLEEMDNSLSNKIYNKDAEIDNLIRNFQEGKGYNDKLQVVKKKD